MVTSNVFLWIMGFIINHLVLVEGILFRDDCDRFRMLGWVFAIIISLLATTMNAGTIEFVIGFIMLIASVSGLMQSLTEDEGGGY